MNGYLWVCRCTQRAWRLFGLVHACILIRLHARIRHNERGGEGTVQVIEECGCAGGSLGLALLGADIDARRGVWHGQPHLDLAGHVPRVKLRLHRGGEVAVKLSVGAARLVNKFGNSCMGEHATKPAANSES